MKRGMEISLKKHNDLQNRDILLCHPPEAAGVLSQKSNSILEPTKQTISLFNKELPQLQVVNSTIYYIWYEYDGANTQIWTATSNLDSSGFTATKQTTSAFSKFETQLQVVNSTIYYTWYENDGANTQIWTATSKIVSISYYFLITQIDVTNSRSLNTTYINNDPNRTMHVVATIRCTITLLSGNAYAQGKSDSSTPPTTEASGIVGVEVGVVSTSVFELSFYVLPGKNYIINKSETNGTVAIVKWFETYI